jgi:metal-responsive CopG/Arc/MetJ family transcriptional regulator
MSKKRGRPTKGDSPLKVRMGFRIPDEMLEEVEAVCKKKGMRKTDFIILSIRSQLLNQRLKEYHDKKDLEEVPSSFGRIVNF